MDNFLRYFYQDIGRVFRSFLEIFNAFFTFLNYLFNYPMRVKIMEEYKGEFTAGETALFVVANILLLAISAAISSRIACFKSISTI